MALSELSDRNAVLAAMREFDELGRDRFLEKYGFGRAKEYFAIGPSGEAYDSKALVGAAFGYQFPTRGPLRASDFNGGENTVERKLEKLGFPVRRNNQDWSEFEVDLIVTDYFEMLRLQSSDTGFSKTDRVNKLRRSLLGRSRSSVEYKHRNISAILDAAGLPVVSGFKPLANVQELLRARLLARIAEIEPLIDDAQITDPDAPAGALTLVAAPAMVAPDRRWHGIPRRIDWTLRDELNRSLGTAGEQWCIEFERRRLVDAGRVDLATEIIWVSRASGDGAGFDIQSFETDGSPRYIEVKTSNRGIASPFLVSHNEVEASLQYGERFFLYRVFDFSTNPKVYILQGDLRATVSLLPTAYRAYVHSE